MTGQRLSLIGEREAIRTVIRHYRQSGLPFGYEDDVSILPVSKSLWIIIKSDMLVASTDVPEGMTEREAGRKSIVSVISDFAAKGIHPLALSVSLGLPRQTTRQKLNQIASGLAQGSGEYKCPIIGGDTNQSSDLVIDVAGFGVSRPGEPVPRNGAEPGDLVCVTGPFGNPAAGLDLMMNKKARFTTSHIRRVLETAVRMPKARLVEGIRLREIGAMTSSIDSSDGLAWSLNEISRLSQVRIMIDKIPISREASTYAGVNRLSSMDLALYGGEEFELVVTVKKRLFPRAKRRVPSLITIGTVKPGSGVYTVSRDGRVLLIRERGWQHFSS